METYYVLLGPVVLALAAGSFRRGFQPVATDLSGINVRDTDGKPLRLGDLIDRPALLVLVRYYG